MDQIPALEIPYEQLKQLVLSIAQSHGSSFEFKNLCNSVGASAVKDGIVASPHPSGFQAMNFPLQQKDEARVREILWNLIIERVLSLGDYNHDGWPWLSVTTYGKTVLTTQQPVPHDPSGYLSRIKREIPDLDLVIEIYLAESIRTYNINQLLSSTITLGCASEKALLELVEVYQRTFKDQARQEIFKKKIEGKFIKSQFDEFEKSMQPNIAALPYELRENYAVSFTAIFQMIRYGRNNAGHPTGKPVDKETLFANLQVFIHYCKYIYSLKAHFEKNGHD